MTWFIQRFRDVFSGGLGEGDAFPYERRVCLWAFCIRLCFILVPAVWFYHYTEYLPVWLGVFGWLWILYGTWGMGWLGAFVWADLGPEEWFRRIFLKHSYNPNIFPIGTLEGYCGTVNRHTLPLWEATKMIPLRKYGIRHFVPGLVVNTGEESWEGDPGSGRFGDE